MLQDYSTVIGGRLNTASGHGSSISGCSNRAGDVGTVCGGSVNSAEGPNATIAGGQQVCSHSMASELQMSLPVCLGMLVGRFD